MAETVHSTQALAPELAAGIDVSDARLMQSDQHWEVFARLRREDPVHRAQSPLFGPFWSITRFHDIMAMEKNYQDFSSDEGITLLDRPKDFALVNFIGMDPPKHDAQRKTVQGVVAPMNLAKLESTIRQRAAAILDSLPVGSPSTGWIRCPLN